MPPNPLALKIGEAVATCRQGPNVKGKSEPDCFNGKSTGDCFNGKSTTSWPNDEFGPHVKGQGFNGLVGKSEHRKPQKDVRMNFRGAFSISGVSATAGWEWTILLKWTIWRYPHGLETSKCEGNGWFFGTLFGNPQNESK